MEIYQVNYCTGGSTCLCGPNSLQTVKTPKDRAPIWPTGTYIGMKAKPERLNLELPINNYQLPSDATNNWAWYYKTK